MKPTQNHAKQSDSQTSKNDPLHRAREVLDAEAAGILAAKDRLGESFIRATQYIEETIKSGGKVVVTGIGKSGKIAAKVAATLASTGTPALFLHAGEALHGDLGMVGPKDTLLFLSYSGSSDEVLKLLPSLRSRGNKLISICGNMKSKLAKESDATIDGSINEEACPLNLAPTTSTTVALALGDALAIVMLEKLGFKEEHFALNHPGGTLGRRLTLLVRDLMKKGEELPWVHVEAAMDTVISVSTEKKIGAVLVRNDIGGFVGIITDGDLRRALKHKTEFFNLKAQDVMTENPVTISPEHKAIEALTLMENRSSQISVLPVIETKKAKTQCVGIVRLHDLIGNL